MSRSRLTVGSLRGIPQSGVTAWGGGRATPFPPPVKLGRGCCRRMCAGCPWAEAMRRAGGHVASGERALPLA